jgi:hypothetical protein
MRFAHEERLNLEAAEKVRALVVVVYAKLQS